MKYFKLTDYDEAGQKQVLINFVNRIILDLNVKMSDDEINHLKKCVI